MRRTSSKKPRKQRARLLRAPIHKKKRGLSAQLSEDLRNRYKIRRLPVRTDDMVFIRIGSFRETEGRVRRVNIQKQRLEIDGITNEKMDGSKVFYPIHPSNVVIVRLGRLDSTRKKIIERRAKEEVEFPEEKPPEEVIEPVDEELDLEEEDMEELEDELEEDQGDETGKREEDKVRSPLSDPDEEE